MNQNRADILYKTELCISYTNNMHCPHWPNCKFAHGMNELRNLTLQDIESELGVDSRTFRVVPCFDFVATGSCPFEERCKAIHDSRAKGPVNWWLRHTKFPLCTQELDLDGIPYIDDRYTALVETIHHGNPFGLDFDSSQNYKQFEMFYNRVTNNCKAESNNCNLDILKLAIALKFLEDSPECQRKFRPTHICHGQVCSVQSKAFLVYYNHGQSVLRQIELPSTTKLFPHVILAHKVMVGPSSMSKPARIYFGNLKLKTVQNDDIKAMIRNQRVGSNEIRINLPSFDLYVPHDDDSLALVRDIFRHKISCIGGIKSDESNKEDLKQISRRFTSLLNFYQSQNFPFYNNKTSQGRISPVSVLYEVSESQNQTDKIWTSFIANLRDNKWDLDPITTSSSSPVSFIEANLPRIKSDMKSDTTANNPYKSMWENILVNESKKWDALKAYYSKKASR